MSCYNCNCDPCSCPGITSYGAFPYPVPATCPTAVNVCCDGTNPCDCAPKLYEEIASFVVPAVDSGVNVTVCDADSWLVGTCVAITDGTNTAILQVASRDTTNNTLFLVNQGASNNPAPGTTISSDAYIFSYGVCPGAGSASGCREITSFVGEAFNIPAEGATGTMRLDDCTNAAVGQSFYIQDIGCVTIQTIDSNDPVAVWTISVDTLSTGVVAGQIVPSGAFVVPSNKCLVTSEEFTGIGSPDEPLTLARIPAFFAHSPQGTQTVDASFATSTGSPQASPTQLITLGDIIPFATVEYDELGDFSNVTNTFTVSVAGQYYLYASAEIDETFVAGEYALALKLNTDNLIWGNSNEPVYSLDDSTDQKMHGGWSAELAVGDTIQVIILDNEGGGPSAVSLEPVTFGAFLIQRESV